MQLDTLVQLDAERPSQYLTKLNFYVTKINNLKPDTITNEFSYLRDKFLSGVSPDKYEFYRPLLRGMIVGTFNDLYMTIREYEMEVTQRENKIRSGKNLSQTCSANVISFEVLPESCSENSSLKDEVKLLHQKFAHFELKNNQSSQKLPLPANETASCSTNVVTPFKTKGDTGFCYNCGLVGHHFVSCRNPANGDLVRTHLLDRSRKIIAKRKATT